MHKELYFRDIGMNCDLVVCGKTEEEVLSKAGEHVLKVHGIKGFSKEFYPKAQQAIREGECEYDDTDETISEEHSDCSEVSIDCADECCC